MQQKTPTKENPEDGYTEIFAWGADRYGQLGLGISKADAVIAHRNFAVLIS